MPKHVLVATEAKYNTLAKTNDRIYFVKDTQKIYTNGLLFSNSRIDWGGY